MRLYLASRSPRRRELLTQMGVAFDTIIFRSGLRTDPQVDEVAHSGEAVLAYVERVARAKADHGVNLLLERRLPLRPVLAADTILEFAGTIIGKPADKADAAATLRRLSGHTHRVLTGVAVAYQGRTEYVLSNSEVRFRQIDDEEIERYVLTGESVDKAGAYGIQGRAGLFIEYMAGSYTGVMGLPVCETGELLTRFGWRF